MSTGGGDELATLEDVACGYGRARILEHVGLAIRRGRVLALIGGNGAGKTTLLRVLLGLLPARAGRLRYAAGVAPRVGYLPQLDESVPLFPVRALDVVRMALLARRGMFARGRAAGAEGAEGAEGAANARGAASAEGAAGSATASAAATAHTTDEARALAALEVLGIRHLAAQPYAALSGGQRQRVLLARAIAGDPDLVVLDEPVRGLDLVSSLALMGSIGAIARRRGAAVVIATHSLELVANHADDVALVRDGRVRAGPVAEIMTSAVLSEFHARPVTVAIVDGHRVVVPGGRA